MPSKKKLPLLTIHDETDDSHVVYVNRGYVVSALRGLAIVALDKGDVVGAVKELEAELENTK